MTISGIQVYKTPFMSVMTCLLHAAPSQVEARPVQQKYILSDIAWGTTETKLHSVKAVGVRFVQPAPLIVSHKTRLSVSFESLLLKIKINGAALKTKQKQQQQTIPFNYI